MATSPDNALIVDALIAAGVPSRNIEVSAETVLGEPASKEGRTNLDGSPKGQVKQAQEPEIPEAPVIPVNTEPSKSESAKKPEQPLSKAEIEAALNQATSKFQSIMDRKINQLDAQMKSTINALNQFFQAQETTDISSLPENEQVLKRLERLEKGGQMPRIQIQQPIEQQPTQFYQQLVSFVDTVGLHVDDKRIDWAPDVSDPQVGFNRFLSSIKKALTEDQTKVIQELKNNGDREIQKLRKQTGVDKVSTHGAGGAGLPDLNKMTPFQKIEYALRQQEIAAKT